MDFALASHLFISVPPHPFFSPIAFLCPFSNWFHCFITSSLLFANSSIFSKLFFTSLLTYFLLQPSNQYVLWMFPIFMTSNVIPIYVSDYLNSSIWGGGGGGWVFCLGGGGRHGRGGGGGGVGAGVGAGLSGSGCRGGGGRAEGI